VLATDDKPKISAANFPGEKAGIEPPHLPKIDVFASACGKVKN
jgi:hypothetical protein